MRWARLRTKWVPKRRDLILRLCGPNPTLWPLIDSVSYWNNPQCRFILYQRERVFVSFWGAWFSSCLLSYSRLIPISQQISSLTALLFLSLKLPTMSDLYRLAITSSAAWLPIAFCCSCCRLKTGTTATSCWTSTGISFILVSSTVCLFVFAFLHVMFLITNVQSS